LTDLGDANWKTRLAILDEMTTWLEGVIADVDAEVVVRAVAKKGWNEKNFQVCCYIICMLYFPSGIDFDHVKVSAKIYNLLITLATHCPSFGRSCVALSVAHLSEKLADAKLKKPAGDVLTTFAEKTSLQFVLNQGTSYNHILIRS
jgi:cytoskeleton-associated protein 5